MNKPYFRHILIYLFESLFNKSKLVAIIGTYLKILRINYSKTREKYPLYMVSSFIDY